MHVDRAGPGQPLAGCAPPPVRRPPIPQSQRRAPTQSLSPAERTAVLGVLNTVGNADVSISQVSVRKLDEGRDWCSLPSTYRIARARKTLGELTPAQAMQRLLFDPEMPIVATTA